MLTLPQKQLPLNTWGKEHAPICLQLLNYINLEHYPLEIASLLLGAICHLIIKCDYKFIVLDNGSERVYKFINSIIISPDYEKQYALKIIKEFQSVIDKGIPFVVFDNKGEKVRKYN